MRDRSLAADRLLVAIAVVFFAVFLFAGIYEHRSQVAANRRTAAANQRAICALERFVVIRYKIDLEVPSIPSSVLARRRDAIAQLKRDADGDCRIPPIPTPKKEKP